ncbi:MAG: hypothetical protein GY880_03405, partial [Planctomycetaceae bacterium]|nr:hypothetical protein [Planctomycetaceae bacterium]
EGRRNIPEPENWPTVSKQLARSVDPLVRERSLQLSQIFGDELATQQALDLVQDDTAEIGRRKAALHLLLNQQNEAASALLPSLITQPDWVVDSVRGYAIMKNDSAPKILLSRYSQFTPSQKRAVLETLASRRSYATALAEAVSVGEISRKDIPAQVSRTLHDMLGDRWIQVYGRSDEFDPAQREAKLERYRQLCQPQNMKTA